MLNAYRQVYEVSPKRRYARLMEINPKHRIYALSHYNTAAFDCPEAGGEANKIYAVIKFRNTEKKIWLELCENYIKYVQIEQLK